MAASIAAVAIAATGVGMAVSADKAGDGADVAAAQSEKPAALWSVAEVLVDSAVRIGTLEESAALGGNWHDHFAVSTTIDGIAGQMMIGRDFGPSEDIDVGDLLASGRPTVETVTVGFKPDSGYENWFWVRYGADGSVLRNDDGRPFAAQFAASADGQCIAQARTAMTPSS